jgi:hypothetical protein
MPVAATNQTRPVPACCTAQSLQLSFLSDAVIKHLHHSLFNVAASPISPASPFPFTQPCLSVLTGRKRRNAQRRRIKECCTGQQELICPSQKFNLTLGAKE